MDLKDGEMGLIFCGKHSHLMTRIQVSDPEPKDPLVLSCGFTNTFSQWPIKENMSPISLKYVTYFTYT